MIVISMALGAFSIWQTIDSYADETTYPTMSLNVKGASEDVTWRVLKTQPFYTDFCDDSLVEKRAEYEDYQLGTPIEKTWTNTDGVVPWWSVSLEELKKCGTVSGVSLANAEDGTVLRSIYAQSFEETYDGIASYIDTSRDVDSSDDDAVNGRLTIDGKTSTESDYDWYAFSNLAFWTRPKNNRKYPVECGSRLNLTSEFAEIWFYNGAPSRFDLPESKDQISTVFTIYFNGAERELDLDESDIEVEAGQTIERVAKPQSSYYGDATVTYATDNEAVATVDAAGVVTGVAAGEANITASIKDGDKETSKSYKVVVTKAADLAVDGVVEAIGNLPTPAKLTLDDESKVDAVQNAYSDLTEDQKALVTNYNILLEARLKIADLKLEKANKDITELTTAKETVEGELKQAKKEKQEAQDELQAIKDKIAASKLTVSGLKVTSKSKKFTITWKKNAKADGYQVQYRLKGAKKFKTLKTVTKTKVVSKKLKKGKKYQFRVAPYKTINGEKVYGNYSTIKACKCK